MLALLGAGCATAARDVPPAAPPASPDPATTATTPRPSEAAPPAATVPAEGLPPAPAGQGSTASDPAEAPAADASVPTEAPVATAPAAPAGAEMRLHAPVGLVRIYEKPDRESPVIGAFRAGQSVAVTDPVMTPTRRQRRLFQCDEGWYPVAPRGWVCVGGADHATRDGSDVRVVAARASLPDLSADYPFRYGVSIGSPQYLRIPTKDEQRQAEPGLAERLAQPPAPDDAAGGAIDLTPAGRPPSADMLKYLAVTKPPLTHAEAAFAGKKVSWSQQFDANGRTWLLTPDMALIPKDTVRVRPLPTLKGVDLKEHPEIDFPIAFFWLEDAHKYKKGEDGKLHETDEVFKRHSFVPATMKQAMGPGGIYWQMKSGDFVKYQLVSMIRKAAARPPGVGPNDKWIEGRVTWGYLIAYEGNHPVYVTAMSPGVDGIAAKGHATARGKHKIGWKLLSGDMSGNDSGKDWFVDEVPWVQYYKDNYAVHGAWWHNDFGRPKSHGCVNLSPPDAKHLFQWMDPVIPEGWYAASSYYPVVDGTTVYLRF